MYPRTTKNNNSSNNNNNNNMNTNTTIQQDCPVTAHLLPSKATTTIASLNMITSIPESLILSCSVTIFSRVCCAWQSFNRRHYSVASTSRFTRASWWRSGLRVVGSRARRPVTARPRNYSGPVVHVLFCACTRLTNV